jgi:hypothetical protein
MISLKRILFLLITVLLGLTLQNCNNDDDPPLPDNAITDNEGIGISLTWSNGTTEEEAIAVADLDLFLLDDNGNVIKASDSFDSFEMLSLLTDDPDGAYDVEVDYFDGIADVNFTISLTRESNSAALISVNGSFSASDAGTGTTIVSTITKSGNTYVIE